MQAVKRSNIFIVSRDAQLSVNDQTNNTQLPAGAGDDEATCSKYSQGLAGLLPDWCQCDR